MNGRAISFPGQVNIYATAECEDAIVYRLSNLLNVSTQNARKYFRQLVEHGEITLEAGLVRLRSQDIEFECPVRLLKYDVISYVPTKDDVQKYLVIQAWT